jgi:hypothetical protein
MMKADSVQRQADGDPATAALRGAIEAKLLVSVRYNQGISILAPYATFLRHGDPYLRAVTVARDGREPSRLKLGTFKLSGLSDLHVTPVPFSPSALYRRIEGYKANG